MKFLSKFGALAATTTAALFVSHAATAVAAVPGNTVLVGDSIVANPTVSDYVQNKASGKTNTGVGCVTEGSIAAEIANASGGTHVDQYQCAGASFATGGVHIDDSLRTAAKHGNLNPQTKNVVIVAGANDTYPYKQDTRASDRAIRNGLRSAINVARHHAPNAKVMVLGYPHVSSHGNTCLSSATIPLPISQVPATEIRLHNALREVAQQSNATFLDPWEISQGHDMCSPNRWWVNLIDPLPPAPGNLPLHLNAHGTHAYGQFIGRNIAK